MIRKILTNQSLFKQVFNKPQYKISVTQQGLNKSLKEEDSEIFDLIKEDCTRQRESINLIASENIPSVASMECVGSIMNAKYSEGYPGQRYYGGTQQVDKAELLCQQRALEAFNLDPKEWGCNVQALSNQVANFAVLTGLIKPHERVMSLMGSHGGDNSVGQTLHGQPLSNRSKFFEVVPYFSTKEGYIDYDRLHIWARIYKPKVITVETYAYSRKVSWDIIRSIADECGAVLCADITQYSALYATQLIDSPFGQADIVTTSTQGSLRGNRGALIFYRKGDKPDGKGKYDYQTKIDQALFPGIQGGPHNHSITGIANALKEVNTNYFKDYATQTIKNQKVFYQSLQKMGYQIRTNGSDINLCIVDLRNRKVNGFQIMIILEKARILAQKTKLPLDSDYNTATGLRLSTSCMTTRGCIEQDFEEIAKLFDRGVQIATKIVEQYGYDFTPQEFRGFISKKWETIPEIKELREDVKKFSEKFPLELGSW